MRKGEMPYLHIKKQTTNETQNKEDQKTQSDNGEVSTPNLDWNKFLSPFKIQSHYSINNKNLDEKILVKNTIIPSLRGGEEEETEEET
ncbi:hypothetical protein CHS0354_006804 [Potamilus streckersoni]|uniref:Uncharacterized protein n=1 Tax=Potamilus streckersoni TaxID=2493646 RepID=A0AAE0VRC2_9BIVA|nr:hypothetical protein CHS0354_006804 [Potamilus streckersoni]